MVQPEDREDGAAVDIILKGKRQMKRKYGVVDYLRKHYPPPEGSREVEVEFLEGYDSIEGPVFPVLPLLRLSEVRLCTSAEMPLQSARSSLLEGRKDTYFSKCL